MNHDLSDSAIEDILMTLPAVYQRAAAFSYLFRLREQVKQREAAPPAPEPVAPTEPIEKTVTAEETEKAIVAWIRETNATDTVRANYARKIADRIEAGEYKA
jgi:hypothetical protein